MRKRVMLGLLCLLVGGMAFWVSQREARADVPFNLKLEKIGDGFAMPLFLTHAGDGSGRKFIVEKGGKIWIMQDRNRLQTPFLDISPLVQSGGYEQGLLGLAFDPKYEENGHFFVYYTARDRDQVIYRYTVSASDANRANPESAVLILRMDDPYPNHNSGMMTFGPDGHLYIATGDGGGGGDPLNAGQNTGILLGKMLRLDVSGELPYSIPADNPFADGRGGLAEIWSYGWRNAWRFSFDRLTGDKYIADVGQNAWEEVHFEPAGARGGLNYGWNVMEGSHCFRPRTNCDRTGLEVPIAEYDRSKGISITGGYVYRGETFRRLQGYYFFGDFGSTRLWATIRDSAGVWQTRELMRTGFPISSFGEDEAGEVYIIDFGGGIYRLEDRM